MSPHLLLAFAPVAVLVAGLGWWIWVKRQRLRGWNRAEGEIIAFAGLKYERPRNPVVRFRARDGREFIHRSRIGSSPNPYVVGQRVPMLYDPACPERAKIATFGQVWGAEMILGGVGTFYLALYLAWVFQR